MARCDPGGAARRTALGPLPCRVAEERAWEQARPSSAGPRPPPAAPPDEPEHQCAVEVGAGELTLLGVLAEVEAAAAALDCGGRAVLPEPMDKQPSPSPSCGAPDGLTRSCWPLLQRASQCLRVGRPEAARRFLRRARPLVQNAGHGADPSAAGAHGSTDAITAISAIAALEDIFAVLDAVSTVHSRAARNGRHRDSPYHGGPADVLPDEQLLQQRAFLRLSGNRARGAPESGVTSEAESIQRWLATLTAMASSRRKARCRARVAASASDAGTPPPAHGVAPRGPEAHHRRQCRCGPIPGPHAADLTPCRRICAGPAAPHCGRRHTPLDELCRRHAARNGQSRARQGAAVAASGSSDSLGGSRFGTDRVSLCAQRSLKAMKSPLCVDERARALARAGDQASLHACAAEQGQAAMGETSLACALACEALAIAQGGLPRCFCSLRGALERSATYCTNE